MHLSDIHLWRFPRNPLALLGKRLVGATELLLGRARRFELDRLPAVVERVRALQADHVVITGDLTTLATPEEFHLARRVLGGILGDPARTTVLPGNHDRYTRMATRLRLFERTFSAFAPAVEYPWVRALGSDTYLMGLDPTRPGLTAQGVLPAAQLARARVLAAAIPPSARLIVACHYPVLAPEEHARELASKALRRAGGVIEWLRGLGRHLYLCGHVHTTWAFRPRSLEDQLSLNPGAAVMKSRTGRNPPGFFEITLQGPDVVIARHAWTGHDWKQWIYREERGFFAGAAAGKD